MSGPVAGVVGGIWAGRQAGYDNVITLDVGGTSADIGLAQEGRLRMKHLLDTKVGPYQAMIPMVGVDIDRRGRRLDRLRRRRRDLPRRRRARRAPIPGPPPTVAAGTEATATDAMVNLGWLLPEAFLGGGMESRRPRAGAAAFERGPCRRRSGCRVEEASMGAVQILSHSMVQSIEENSVRKGFDPRDFALVAEGGAGPLFAAQIALEVGTPRVLVRPIPGITAAMGLLATDMVYEYAVDGLPAALDSSTRRRSRRGSRSSRRSAARPARGGRRSPPDQIVVQRVADCRYLGQGYELRVDVGSGAIDDAWVETAARRLPRHPRARVLAAVRGRRTSRCRTSASVGSGCMPAARDAGGRGRATSRPDAALRYEGEAWFRVDGELDGGRRPRYYDRAALKAGNRLAGPAIVNQYDSTTVIPPGVIGARRPLREHRRSRPATSAARGGRTAGGGDAGMSVDRVRGRAAARARRRANASRSTRSRLRASAARFHATAKEMAGVLFRM